jgi:hypothetical protein
MPKTINDKLRAILSKFKFLKEPTNMILQLSQGGKLF